MMEASADNCTLSDTTWPRWSDRMETMLPDSIAVEIDVEIGDQGFRHFWAKRVTGFDGAVHCAECLRGPRQQDINKRLAQGGRATLSTRAGSLIYICGVASPRNWSNNFHLAMRVTDGGQTVSQLYTGATIKVSNAVAIPIADDAARNLFSELPEEFLTCRNFQFGAQQFGRPNQ